MQLFSSLTLSAYYARETHGRALHRAKFSEKVHKPPLWVNVINFGINGLNASKWVPWSHDALIEVFKSIKTSYILAPLESETLKIYFDLCEPFRRS